MVDYFLFATTVTVTGLLLIQSVKCKKMQAYFQRREAAYVSTLKTMRMHIQRSLTSPTEEALELTLAEITDELTSR